MRTYSELTALIKSLRNQLTVGGPCKASEIAQIEYSFNVKLPSDFKQFLGNFGSVQVGRQTIFGLAHSEGKSVPSVEQMLLLLRLTRPDLPFLLVPIHSPGNQRFACLLCQTEKSNSVQVVEVDLTKPLVDLPQLAPSFVTYVYDLLQDFAQQRESGHRDEPFRIFANHVKQYQSEFNYDHAKGGRLPRNHDWRPYRYCIQDVLFGATVVRHQREANCLEVDVFLTARVPEYGDLAGARALAAFLLSEAYKCGGTMEIRFTRNVEGGRVPKELQQLATHYGLSFLDAMAGRVDASEARSLYAALTDFSPRLQERIQRTGRVRMERACFAVHHGLWTREQVEMFALGSQQPDSILSGLAQPHQRHLYLHDLIHARGALLAGTLERRLLKRERTDTDGKPYDYDLEDDVRPLQIDFEGEMYAKSYLCPEALAVPWLYPSRKLDIPANTPFHVLVRARDMADIEIHFVRDIEAADWVQTQTNQPVFVLLPQDFLALPQTIRDAGLQLAAQKGVNILVCPEFVNTYDNDAAQKLARSRILRQ